APTAWSIYLKIAVNSIKINLKYYICYMCNIVNKLKKSKYIKNNKKHESVTKVSYKDTEYMFVNNSINNIWIVLGDDTKNLLKI
ncbi:hypothetical protein, partial [uncultured Nostoc sp.]|uniref:hypothetical protein n=1 Tax=uncultured Nostoc sp. TaxID=340711 RepID=UPI0035CC9E62